MKKFTINTVLFILCFLSISLILSEIKFSNEFIISKTKDTNFEKLAWNIHLIENNPESIKGSIVFLGPSLVLNGINDSLLNSNKIKSVNLAVNHLGNESMLFILNKIKTLSPKEVILFKNQTPVLRTHQLSPLLFSSLELFNSGQSINFYFFEHLLKRLKFVSEYLTWTYFKTNKQIYQPNNRFGVRLNNNICSNYSKIRSQSFTTDETLNLYQNNYTYSSEKENQSKLIKLNTFKRKILDYLWYKTNLYNSRSQELFLRQIKTLCNKTKIKCSMIYIPKVKDLKQEYIYNRNYYRQIDSDPEVYLIDNYRQLDDSTLWADYQHLSKKGSMAFTNMLISSKIFNRE